MRNNIVRIISIVMPILFVAVLGSIFVNLGMDWFNALEKPSQWIANPVIPIVWTLIYIACAVILVLWTNKEELPNQQ